MTETEHRWKCSSLKGAAGMYKPLRLVAITAIWIASLGQAADVNPHCQKLPITGVF